MYVLFLQNLRVVAQYYTRITMQRLSELLSLSIDVSNTACIYMYCDPTLWTFDFQYVYTTLLSVFDFTRALRQIRHTSTIQ